MAANLQNYLEHVGLGDQVWAFTQNGVTSLEILKGLTKKKPARGEEAKADPAKKAVLDKVKSDIEKGSRDSNELNRIQQSLKEKKEDKIEKKKEYEDLKKREKKAAAAEAAARAAKAAEADAASAPPEDDEDAENEDEQDAKDQLKVLKAELTELEQQIKADEQAVIPSAASWAAADLVDTITENDVQAWIDSGHASPIWRPDAETQAKQKMLADAMQGVAELREKAERETEGDKTAQATKVHDNLTKLLGDYRSLGLIGRIPDVDALKENARAALTALENQLTTVSANMAEAIKKNEISAVDLIYAHQLLRGRIVDANGLTEGQAAWCWRCRHATTTATCSDPRSKPSTSALPTRARAQ